MSAMPGPHQRRSMPKGTRIDRPAVRPRGGAGIAAHLDARRVLEAPTGGTLVVRTDGGECRALEEAGTIAAFALWNRPGM